MKEELRLTEWLADYRDSLDGVSTPGRVEALLRSEVRRRRRIPVAPWLLAAGAAAVLALGIWIGRSRTVVPTPIVNLRTVAPGLPVVGLPLVDLPVEELAPGMEQAGEPVRSPRRLPTSRARLIPSTPEEQQTAGPAVAFVMLPGSELMPPAQDLQVLRVRIPRTRIQALGWPVNVDRLDERVLADVIVGEDGVARAIRLVQVSQ